MDGGSDIPNFLASGSGRRKKDVDEAAKLWAEVELRARNVVYDLHDIKTDLPDAADGFRNAMDDINQQVETGQQIRLAALEEQLDRPLARLRSQLQESSGDMDKALEGVAVNGLHSLEDGLTGLISGTRSAGQAFKDMARGIVADLARIGIERTILGAIGGGGGAVGGFFSKLFGGARAAGGGIDASKFYLVGEKGPELFAPGRSGTIIPNHALAAPRLGNVGRGASGNGPTFDLRGAVMTVDLLRQMQAIAAQTGGQVLTQAVSHTNDMFRLAGRSSL